MSNAVGRRRHQGTHSVDIIKIVKDENPPSQSPAAAAAAAAGGGGVVVSDRTTGDNLAAMYKNNPTVGAMAALLYGSVAVAMGFINKAVMMTLPESNFLLLWQMIVTVLVMFLLKGAKLLHFSPINAKQAKKLLPVAILYNANVAFALGSLAKVSVPTYNTLKRMTPAIVLIANRVFRLKPDPSRSVVLTIIIVVFGCLVAGYGDLEFDPLGYVMGLTSCMLQASYMICVEKTGAERGVSSVELMVYNALLSAPPLAGIVFFTGEFGSGMRRVSESIVAGDTGFIVTFVTALLAGMLLNYALFLCTLTNSALTTTVVGVLKGVASTLLGFFLLGGVKLSALHVAGITINTSGGVAYSCVTYQEKQLKRMQQKSGPSNNTSNASSGAGGAGSSSSGSGRV